jgi:hypothetical protein
MLKNITLSAEEELISKAREKARLEHQSLNQLFRKWLENFTGNEKQGEEYLRLMQEIDYAEARGFTREELNER